MNPDAPEIVLALDLHPSSFGFAVFEGSSELLDWGIKSFWRCVNAVKVPMPAKLARLIDQYEPEMIVMKVPRTTIVRRRVHTVTELARRRRIRLRLISEAAIRKSFPLNNQNKYQIATAIAERFPEISPRLGARRKMWQAEKYSMSIFDAAALGLSYFTPKAKHGLGQG
jgi:hypothetical protein